MSEREAMNAQIYEEASGWLVEFRTGNPDADGKRRLDEWLRRSPEHVRAYLEVSAVWEDAALHDPRHTVSAEAHIARARTEDNIVPLQSPKFGGGAEGPGLLDPRRFRGRRRVFAAVALVLVCAGALGSWLYRDLYPSYATDTGEQRSIALPDGSTVNLNTRSRIRVRYSQQERGVELLEGQALFQVASDRTRPFVVRSADTAVRAVGTQFDVYRRPAATTVTVIEGRVAVSSGAGTKDVASFIGAGEQLTVSSDRPAERRAAPQPANVAAVTAWTQRRLVFDSAPLREVVEEFNRYNTRPMVIRDAALADFGIVGVFSSTDPGSLLRFLRGQAGMIVLEEDERIVIAAR